MLKIALECEFSVKLNLYLEKFQNSVLPTLQNIFFFAFFRLWPFILWSLSRARHVPWPACPNPCLRTVPERAHLSSVIFFRLYGSRYSRNSRYVFTQIIDGVLKFNDILLAKSELENFKNMSVSWKVVCVNQSLVQFWRIRWNINKEKISFM